MALHPRVLDMVANASRIGFMLLLAAGVLASTGAVEGADKPSPTRQVLAYWAHLPSQNFGGNVDWFESVNLRERASKASVQVSPEQRIALVSMGKRLVRMLRAPDFETYEVALKETFLGPVIITPRARGVMRSTLMRSGAVDRPDSLPDGELLESYWVMMSKLGYGSRYFTGYCPEESFFLFSTATTLPVEGLFPDPFPDDTVMVGGINRITSFVFNGAKPEDELKAGRLLIIADVRLMLNTKDPNLAYPISTRLWWSVRLQAWIPWFCMEYNNVNRSFDVTF